MWCTHTLEYFLSLKKGMKYKSVDEDVEKLGPLCAVGGNVKWCGHSGKQYDRSSKVKKKKELPYDPVISPLGISPKLLKAVSERDICTPIFTAALFTTAKR